MIGFGYQRDEFYFKHNGKNNKSTQYLTLATNNFVFSKDGGKSLLERESLDFLVEGKKPSMEEDLSRPTYPPIFRQNVLAIVRLTNHYTVARHLFRTREWKQFSAKGISN